MWLPAAHDTGRCDALVLVASIRPSTGEGTAPCSAQTLPRTWLLPNLGPDGLGQGRLGVHMNPGTPTGVGAVTDGLDGFRESQILLRRVRGEDTRASTRMLAVGNPI